MNIKEQIRVEIGRRMDKHWDLLPNADSPEDDWTHNELCELGAFKELEHLEQFLDSLQQEQPEMDFETEYAKFSNDPDALDYTFPIDLADYKDFARHFYELGKNARKEDK